MESIAATNDNDRDASRRLEAMVEYGLLLAEERLVGTLRDPGEPEGPHPGARRLGGGASGAGPLGARHRGRVSRRERAAVSEIGGGGDYQEVATRDLSEYDIDYLFVDGIAERIRSGQKREPMLAASGASRRPAPRCCCT